MTYTRKRKIVRLEYDSSHDWAGLVVRTRSLSTGLFRKIIQFGALMADGDGRPKLSAKDAAEIPKLFDIFAGVLIDWTLEEEDEDGAVVPVPPTGAGIDSQDIDFVLALMGDWIGQIVSVSPDLGKGSNSGGISPAPSLPMAPLSPSPQS